MQVLIITFLDAIANLELLTASTNDVKLVETELYREQGLFCPQVCPVQP